MEIKSLLLFGYLGLLLCTAQAQDLKQGMLLHDDGTVEEGYIYYNERYKHYLHFTLEPNKEPVVVPAQEIKGFIQGQDTFEVLKNFFVRDGLLKAHYPIGFAQVKVEGNVTLYYHKHVSVESQTKGDNRVITELLVESFLLKKHQTEEVILVRSSKKKFKEVLSSYFKDCESLCRDILKEKYTYSDIEHIVKAYNNWRIR